MAVTTGGGTRSRSSRAPQGHLAAPPTAAKAAPERLALFGAWTHKSHLYSVTCCLLLCFFSFFKRYVLTMLLALPCENRSKYLQKKLVCLGAGRHVPAGTPASTWAGVSDHLHSQMRKPRLSKGWDPPTATRLIGGRAQSRCQTY